MDIPPPLPAAASALIFARDFLSDPARWGCWKPLYGGKACALGAIYLGYGGDPHANDDDIDYEAYRDNEAVGFLAAAMPRSYYGRCGRQRSAIDTIWYTNDDLYRANKHQTLLGYFDAAIEKALA